MKRGWLVAVFLVFSIELLPMSAQSGTAALDRSQLMAWLAGGLSSARLQRLIVQRGLTFTLDAPYRKQLEGAGADASLLEALQKTMRSGANDPVPCPPALAQAAKFVREHQLDDAEEQLRLLLRSSPENPDLHFALGEVLRRQEQWDPAFDEFTVAVRLALSRPRTVRQRPVLGRVACLRRIPDP